MPSLSEKAVSRSWQGMSSAQTHTVDFGFDIIDSIRSFDLKGNSLSREGLDEDLHAGLGKF